MHAHLSRNLGLAALGLALCCLALGLSNVARAEDTPERGLTQPAVDQSAEGIQAPAVGPQLPDDLRLGGLLVPQTLAPVDALDRGSLFTDAGLGLRQTDDNTLNAIERAKLEMARAAVEASRAAGTLHVTGPQPRDPGDLDALRAAKEALQKSMAPAPVPAEPDASGIGAEVEPIQLIGPREPTAAELEKLGRSYPAQSEPAATGVAPARKQTAEPAIDPDLKSSTGQEVK